MKEKKEKGCIIFKWELLDTETFDFVATICTPLVISLTNDCSTHLKVL